MKKPFPVNGVLVAVLLLLAQGGASAQQPGNAVVSAPAPVRLYPDVQRTPLTTLNVGTTVTIVEHEGDWYKVSFRDRQYGDRVGYVRGEHLKVGVIAPTSAGSAAAPSPAKTSLTTSPSPIAPPNGPPATPREVPAEPPVAVLTGPRPPAAPTAARGAMRFGGLSERAVESSVSLGSRQRGGLQGLRLMDSGQAFATAFAGLGSNGVRGSDGFHLQVYTPLAWIRQMASDAAKEYRPFTIDDVGEEAVEPVLRVIAYPDTPNTVAAGGLVGTASVQHVVLRDVSRKIVIQPIFKESFTEEVSNAMGGRAAYEGVRLKFSMDAVRELRGPNGDREFFITVVGSTHEQKDFRVKKKHFDELPDEVARR